jgi:hypothetical protein
MVRRTSMVLLELILAIFVALVVIILVAILDARRAYTPESAQEVGEPFGLKEGQTIMAVVEEKRTLYFCIGRDPTKRVQQDEDDVE